MFWYKTISYNHHTTAHTLYTLDHRHAVVVLAFTTVYERGSGANNRVLLRYQTNNIEPSIPITYPNMTFLYRGIVALISTFIWGKLDAFHTPHLVSWHSKLTSDVSFKTYSRSITVKSSFGGNDNFDNEGDSSMNSQFFDDFGDSLLDESSSAINNRVGTHKSDAVMESLKSKMIETREIEAAFDAKLARNWRRGNWSVRGFALDKDRPSAQISPSNRQEQQDAVHVSTVVAPISYSIGGMPMSRDKTLPEYRTVAVGRTDGSVFLVRLGEDYLTKFSPSAKLVIEKSKEEDDRTQESDGSFRIDEGWNQQDDRGDERKLQPFEILLNFQSSDSSEQCHSIAFHDIAEDSDNNGYICTAAGDSGEIKLWTLPLDFVGSNAIQPTSLSGAHQARIIALKTILVISANNDEEQHLLLSASCDGVIAFWELNKEGKLLFSCQCLGNKKEHPSLTCADVSNPSLGRSYIFSDANRQIAPDMMFFGTSDGYIIGYNIQSALANGECTEPDISFRAHGLDSGKGEGICAIKCGGDGTIPTSTSGAVFNRPAQLSSTILLTGGEDGSIKQWWVIF